MRNYHAFINETFTHRLLIAVEESEIELGNVSSRTKFLLKTFRLIHVLPNRKFTILTFILFHFYRYISPKKHLQDDSCRGSFWL